MSNNNIKDNPKLLQASTKEVRVTSWETCSQVHGIPEKLAGKGQQLDKIFSKN